MSELGSSTDTPARRSLGWVSAIAAVAMAAGIGYWTGLYQPSALAPIPPPVPMELPAAVPPPPFFIKGTVISPQSRLAHVAVLDDTRREKQTFEVREGESLEGYRLARIENHRVYFERDGAMFLLPVGGSTPVSEPPPPADARRTVPEKERSGEFVPPPANIEEIRRETESFVERLRQDPEFQKNLGQKKRELAERQEREGRVAP